MGMIVSVQFSPDKSGCPETRPHKGLRRGPDLSRDTSQPVLSKPQAQTGGERRIGAKDAIYGWTLAQPNGNTADDALPVARAVRNS